MSYLTEGVQNSRTSRTQHGVVFDRRQIGSGLEGSVQRADRDDVAGGFEATCGPDIPAQAHSIAVLFSLNKVREGSHLKRKV